MTIEDASLVKFGTNYRQLVTNYQKLLMTIRDQLMTIRKKSLLKTYSNKKEDIIFFNFTFGEKSSKFSFIDLTFDI